MVSLNFIFSDFCHKNREAKQESILKSGLEEGSSKRLSVNLFTGWLVMVNFHFQSEVSTFLKNIILGV